MANYRDGYLEQGQALPALTQRVSLSADGQAVVVGVATMVEIYSDSTTATDRTFTISDGAMQGHRLTLVLASGSSTAAELADSGNCALSAAWQPTQYDTLVLVWSKELAKWLEVSRANN